MQDNTDFYKCLVCYASKFERDISIPCSYLQRKIYSSFLFLGSRKTVSTECHAFFFIIFTFPRREKMFNR